MKTPEQIVKRVFKRWRKEVAPAWGRGYYTPSDDQFAEMAVEAIKADRVQHERADRLPDGEVRFTIKFDAEVWPTLTPRAQQEWIDEVNAAIVDIAQITYTEVGR